MILHIIHHKSINHSFHDLLQNSIVKDLQYTHTSTLLSKHDLRHSLQGFGLRQKGWMFLKSLHYQYLLVKETDFLLWIQYTLANKKKSLKWGKHINCCKYSLDFLKVTKYFIQILLKISVSLSLDYYWMLKQWNFNNLRRSEILSFRGSLIETSMVGFP